MQCSERAISAKTETCVSALIVLETTREQSLTVWCTRNKFARYNEVLDIVIIAQITWTSGDAV